MGWPVGHSLSPRLHGFWLAELGIGVLARVPNFSGGSARSIVVLYKEDVEAKLKEMYDCVPEQMNRWIVADDTWVATKKLITDSNFGFVDASEQGAREEFVESMENEAMKTGISLLKVGRK